MSAQVCLSRNFSIATENAANPAQPIHDAFGPPKNMAEGLDRLGGARLTAIRSGKERQSLHELNRKGKSTVN